MRRVVLPLVLIAALAGVVSASVAAARVYSQIHEPYKGYDTPEQFVEIPPGARADAIAQHLINAGVVRDRWVFRVALWQSGSERHLQAGEYHFERSLTPIEVVDKLVRGQVYLRPITFPEGLTIQEMARIFEVEGFGTAASFIEMGNRGELIAALDADASNLEGYLFPDTYALPRDATADDLVRLMIERFEQAFDADVRRTAAARGRTIREVVTLASLIQKEAAKPEDRPLISAVYNNRLRIGMALQCDPTVIYALQLAGLYDGNLTRESLTFDSPYNTYRYAGLPSGPIAAPGRDLIEAALHPADVKYLYFVSRNDGSHAFANSLREHNRNVQKYQVRYFRERRSQQPKVAGKNPTPER